VPQAKIFAACLATAGALGIGLVIAAWTVEPQAQLGLVELPDHVTRLAFGVDAEQLDPDFVGKDVRPGAEQDTALPGPPVRVRVNAEELAFLGLGDLAVATYVVERYVPQLSVCYGADELGQVDQLHIDLSGGRALARHPDPEREACLAGLIKPWPWPADLSGSLSLSLRVGASI
jgi:hypothetical protein